MTIKPLAACLLSLSLSGSLHGESSPWRTSRSADGRFLVRGTAPEWVQGITVWSSRGLRELERFTGVPLAGTEADTLTITLHPRAEETRLLTQRGRGALRQEIITPGKEPFDTQGLADAFTRALLERAATRADDAPPVPDWLVFGLSHHLMEGQSESLYLHGLRLWREKRLPPTPSLTRSPTTPDTNDARAHSAWVTRMLLRPGGTRPPIPLQRLLSGSLDESDWTNLWPEVQTLRDLNIDRDLWMMTRDRGAIAEFRAEVLAEQRLAQIAPLRPAEFGLEGPDVPRYQTFTLAGLEPFVDEPWLEPLLVQWMVRLQPLGFRQSESFAARIQAKLEAAGHLSRAASSKGRARERHLQAFRHALLEADTR